MTKDKIINLINTATYSTGEPVRRKHNQNGVGDVDILGAVLKDFYKSSNYDDLCGIADILTGGVVLHKHPVKLLAKGNLWGALAAHYDNLSYMMGSETPTPEIREELVNFVTTYFPDTITMPDFELPVEYQNSDPSKNPPSDMLTYSLAPASARVKNLRAGWDY